MSRCSPVKNPLWGRRQTWNAFPAAMSEFKYACPVCGQHIKCDSSQSGTTMECPTCFQKIIAPQAPGIGRPEIYHQGHEKWANGPFRWRWQMRARPPCVSPKKIFPWPAIAFVVLFCAAAAVLFGFTGKFQTCARHRSVRRHGGTNAAHPNRRRSRRRLNFRPWLATKRCLGHSGVGQQSGSPPTYRLQIWQ